MSARIAAVHARTRGALAIFAVLALMVAGLALSTAWSQPSLAAEDEVVATGAAGPAATLAEPGPSEEEPAPEIQEEPAPEPGEQDAPELGAEPAPEPVPESMTEDTGSGVPAPVADEAQAGAEPGWPGQGPGPGGPGPGGPGPGGPDQGGPGQDGKTKVTLCHRTNSAKNPYNQITVDAASVSKQGHDGHTGPVFDPEVHDQHNRGWGDIIPPFEYREKGEVRTYPGMNWPDGEEILANGCIVPDPGGEDPGGEDPGGEDPGGEDPGGEDPGGEDPGGEDPGGEDPGGEDPDDEEETDVGGTTETRDDDDPDATDDSTHDRTRGGDGAVRGGEAAADDGDETRVLAETTAREDGAEPTDDPIVPTRIDAGGGGAARGVAPMMALGGLLSAVAAAVVAGRGLLHLR